ncbi:SGNH/GDSL hydrolase family protein [Streptomyces sp. NPDC048504]|uniref:SGNH/GDSL hydrolase family protein n=1 Tax=Streptomyces sp. NPDC048504 TaxID=3365559 RepID=UPI0037138123
MRKKRTRTSVTLALAGLLATLITFVSSGTAVAAESIPETQFSPVGASNYTQRIVTGPDGSVTVPCVNDNGTKKNLKTYSATGQLVRELSATSTIDGVANCIYNVAVAKNGDLYGAPDQGPNLLAYRGNTLKWKYPLGCTSYMARPVMGADGNVYAINNNGRLIGLTPEVEPGTTQPKKVLDVPVTNASCSTELLALKDGIVTIEGLTATFYSYGGVNLGSPPSVAKVKTGVSQISASGRQFYSTYVESNGLRSANVSAYDYGRKQVAWTATASVNGAYVNSADAYATPDGGTLVYLREKERDQFGADTGYTAYNLVKLNAFGIVQWRENLPRNDASGNSFGEPYIKVDVNGNVAVARNGQLATNDPSNGYVEGISIAMFTSNGDGNGNAVAMYNQTMRGNLDKNSGSVTGYYLNSMTLSSTQGVLFFNAQQCTTSCTGAIKMYPIKVTGLGLDYPRGVIYDEAPRPAASYIALGDSFSAGEGVEPFEAGTDTPNLNKCHRSDYAYPRLISGTSAKIPSLGSNGFRACSGAVTDNITDAPQWNEGTQLDLPVWPDSSTQLVTMTIGGNDIKFGDLGTACVTASCAIGSSAYNASLNEINNTLPAKLEATYKKILQQTPNAKVYVLGYPQVIANKAALDAFDNRCFYMYDNSNTTNKWADVHGARDIVTKLNAKIQQKVNDVRAMNAGNQRLVYVPLDGTGSPFNGHEVCGTASSSWFQNVDQAFNGLEYVFHPNKLGYEGYATVAGAAINAG